MHLADFGDDELRNKRADGDSCMGDTGLFGSNKSIGGDSQSSQLCC